LHNCADGAVAAAATWNPPPAEYKVSSHSHSLPPARPVIQTLCHIDSMISPPTQSPPSSVPPFPPQLSLLRSTHPVPPFVPPSLSTLLPARFNMSVLPVSSIYPSYIINLSFLYHQPILPVSSTYPACIINLSCLYHESIPPVSSTYPSFIMNLSFLYHPPILPASSICPACIYPSIHPACKTFASAGADGHARRRTRPPRVVAGRRRPGAIRVPSLPP
jgi:hypothetical protein